MSARGVWYTLSKPQQRALDAAAHKRLTYTVGWSNDGLRMHAVNTIASLVKLRILRIDGKGKGRTASTTPHGRLVFTSVGEPLT